MHRNLIRDHKLVGTHRDEILPLLGPRSSLGHSTGPRVHYRMGPATVPIRIDSIWLLLRLEGDRVAEYVGLSD